MEDTNKPEVTLSGVDGNAFAIMGVVDKACRRQGFDPEVFEAFKADATSGDYDNFLQSVFRHCNVVG